MSQDLLPVLAHRENMRIVEVDGQPVVTARDLARALEYSKDNAVAKIYDRNRDSFTNRDSFVVDMRKFVPKMGMNQVNNENRFDVNLTVNPQGGDPHIRVFTKRGALKICMKSNQPKAVAVQDALINLYEQVERGELVSAGYLQNVVRELKSEINRLSRLIAGAGGNRNVQPVQVVYVPRRHKPRSFDDAALAFLQELFIQKPRAKVVELDRHLREEAAKQGWKVGSKDSVYRAVANWKKVAKSLSN
ncbi:prophage antirepressor [Desulfofarcimen acetoxidans DSM 771]|uniref:Prophage antirepressor n=1 Tax=Desulfofarcimen acetoxidans (strain ATCC 49208 / DSM 771 / KCTC 5769 / VKM B-1644 / 5575) TaxID=485916 RepID=C8VZD1_DESAS|nr:BRO family protein [Desulfofarcimen acetoxidans]ACV64876.1 prophage antirepressor [Desulfofarcimen acetoxidans DSM 771]